MSNSFLNLFKTKDSHHSEKPGKSIAKSDLDAGGRHRKRLGSLTSSSASTSPTPPVAPVSVPLAGPVSISDTFVTLPATDAPPSRPVSPSSPPPTPQSPYTEEVLDQTFTSSLRLPTTASPVRRRSMTVPIDVALVTLPLSSAAGGQHHSSGEGSEDASPLSPRDASVPLPGSSSTLPPRRANRFVVSKISEDAIKVGGGSALIFPPPRSTSSSVAGSPEILRAKSPLGALDDPVMLSPHAEPVPGSSVRPTVLPMASQSGSLSRGSSLGKGSTIDQNGVITSPVAALASPEPEHEPFLFLGVCAMAKKAKSKYMTEILRRITQEFEQIKTVVFDEQQILNDPVEKWPIVDALISFQSERFPLDKTIQYWKLRNPFLVNDLEMQKVLKDRREVYKLVKSIDIELPRYAILDRETGNPEDAQLEEAEDFIVVNGIVFNKPFVEKPVEADDHNIYIYYPISAGGGSQRLFRKIGSRSSVYSAESKIRRNGSYIYEEFMPTDGTDVKVYTVGTEYAHAEARKSPALDGVVERDKDGKEIRFPVILNNIEKLIARRICSTFKQTVCGFDLLRANGRSYVCDVNGFSFVKNSMIYYSDCAKIIANNILRKLAPQLHIPWSIPFQLDDPPIVTTTLGRMMELRCVIAVVRHGDRTPKQKMKMEMQHRKFFDVYTKFGGRLDAEGREIKLKKPKQLQEILDIVRELLTSHMHEAEVKDKRAKLEQLKSVLEMYGHFSGINRKIQIKYQHVSKLDSPTKAEATDEPKEADPSLPAGSLVLIMKWGGELTPLGKYQSEQLGMMFRCMYPGSEEFSRKKGHGLLRLHSTFRHDLKIYASDEGRVQSTAAAFAKGLLALEGELTPILVQMVKSADTNGLLDNDLDARENENTVKKRLKAILKQDRAFNEEDRETLNPTGSVSIKLAMEEVQNPVKACEEMYEGIRELNVTIREKSQSVEGELPTLYSGESWDLLPRRWAKLEKDFKLKDATFDITKIPDIYDCIKFDMHHNQWINRYACAKRVFVLARNLANIVVPLEYGITLKEKLAIAQGVATPLLKKIRADMQHVIDVPESQDDPENVNRLHPRFSQNVASPGRMVRSRLYFTSESHIHSLMNIFRFGGLIPANDAQWTRAMAYISSVPEFNFLTQIVIMMYEDPKKDINSDDRFHIELHFSPGMLLRSDDLEPEGPGFWSMGKSAGPSTSSDPAHANPLPSIKHSTATLKNESNLSIMRSPSTSRRLTSGSMVQGTSMSHLADGWLDNLDANSTINFPKTKFDRSIYKTTIAKDDTGVHMNRVFSTAVIKGLSSGSSLDKMEDAKTSADLNCLHVPNVNSLETLHNALSFRQLDTFLETVTSSGSRQVSTVTSPSRTPEQPIFGTQTVTDGTQNSRLFVHQESVLTDFLSEPSRPESPAVTSPTIDGSGGFGANNRFFSVHSTPTPPPLPLGGATSDATSLALDDKENFSSMQQTPTPDLQQQHTREERSPSSSPVIESLISSPVKERKDDGDKSAGPAAEGVVKNLNFDFDAASS
ncbi:Inositol hexakisphosphate and diphosphoinositol-pentakisphosphate kinase [Hypsibius exemplaris]|uniref:Inositol hexakisphosphate and diphosphoinositol-pentakisphosphate kinase n=1 Tax=Hypsibius exemplaris TaxID=2072580 RepID=A0A1W0WMH9_HYPEX|nr:Inositol hexakisphosphate and diphosphoinositol-pentakisphosphate kinase [Hypsibius exemplaris]